MRIYFYRACITFRGLKHSTVSGNYQKFENDSLYSGLFIMCVVILEIFA